VGNRLQSERLSRLVSFEELKLAAAVVLLSPSIPLLFMGEEYGETAPFPYFIDHGDAALNQAVWRGRQAEFTRFNWHGQIPDPKDEATFRRAMLNRRLADEPEHRRLLDFYRRLIHLRKSVPALSLLSKDHREISWNEARQVLACRRWSAGCEVLIVCHFGKEPAKVAVPAPKGRWRSILSSVSSAGGTTFATEAADLESSGELPLELAPTSVLLLQRIAAENANA
jgi:maltooligosyltrehalose trehalohydrolase